MSVLVGDSESRRRDRPLRLEEQAVIVTTYLCSRRKAMAASITTTLYTYVADQLPELRQFAAALVARGADPVEVRLATEELQVLLARQHSAFGRGPVGVLVGSDTAVLDAIALGADDAVVMPTLDEPAVLAFLDRVRLRAKQRREVERITQDVAHAEKLTALGTLVAGVGHELNNPLSAITLNLEILSDLVMNNLKTIVQVKELAASRERDPALLEALTRLAPDHARVGRIFEDVSAATDLVAELVRDLRVFSRSSHLERTTVVDPSSVIEQALRLVRREIISHGIIERDYDAHVPKIVAPRNRLTQVLTNLLVNAAHAIAERPGIAHRVRVSVRSDEQFVAISVSDTGPGVPEDAIERIFDPFYTTKREGYGTGLGLSISRAALRQLGGDLMVTSVYGEGATFICLIPLATPDSLQAANSWVAYSIEIPEEVTSMNVLLVDDDERVLRAGARVLQGRHRVLTARDGQEAIELLSSGSNADVVVLELDVPEVDGIELYEWLEANQPQLAKRVVIATAAQDRERFSEFLRQHPLTVLSKPFRADALLNAIERFAPDAD